MASVPFMTVLENMALTRPWRYSRRAGFSMQLGRGQSDVQSGMKKLGGNLSLYALARTLSGGNLQRMVIIRELGLDARLIVASYVTRGIGRADRTGRASGACWMPARRAPACCSSPRTWRSSSPSATA